MTVTVSHTVPSRESTPVLVVLVAKDGRVEQEEVSVAAQRQLLYTVGGLAVGLFVYNGYKSGAVDARITPDRVLLRL
jgi:hypothetical protein